MIRFIKRWLNQHESRIKELEDEVARLTRFIEDLCRGHTL